MQTVELQNKNNSFDVSNHVHCFNHTIQLSYKALLKPFTSSTSSSTTDNDNMADLESIKDDDKDESEAGDAELASNTDDNTYDDIDELNALSGEEQAIFLEATMAVKDTVAKVRMLRADNSYCAALIPKVRCRLELWVKSLLL